MFCPKCKSLMYLKNGSFICKKCGYKQEPIGRKPIKTKREEKRHGIIEEEFELLPKTKIRCPRCGSPEAFWEIRQLRASDEPETKFYRCCKCKYCWREE